METDLNKIIDIASDTNDELCKGLKPKKAKLVQAASAAMAQTLLTAIFGEEPYYDAVMASMQDRVAKMLHVDPEDVRIVGPIDITQHKEKKDEIEEPENQEEQDLEESVQEEPEGKQDQVAFYTKVVEGNVHTDAVWERKSHYFAGESRVAEEYLIDDIAGIIRHMSKGDTAKIKIKKGILKWKEE